MDIYVIVYKGIGNQVGPVVPPQKREEGGGSGLPPNERRNTETPLPNGFQSLPTLNGINQ